MNIIVFLDFMPCGLVEIYNKSFGGACRLHLRSRNTLNMGIALLHRNIVKYLPNYMASSLSFNSVLTELI
jgi:hypothetical protein